MGLVDRELALLEERDEVSILVQATDPMAKGSDADAGDQADVAAADDGDSQGILPVMLAENCSVFCVVRVGKRRR